MREQNVLAATESFAGKLCLAQSIDWQDASKQML